MSVESRPLVNGQSRGSAAPLDRRMLDSAASPTRVFFGLVFLAWSWVSTVLIGGRLLAPAIPGAGLGVPDSYLVAFAFALLVTGLEFVSAGRWPIVYWPVLIFLDAPFTTYQTHAWFTALATPYAPGGISGGMDLLLWLLALVCGIIAAICGELLLFGRRR